MSATDPKQAQVNFRCDADLKAQFYECCQSPNDSATVVLTKFMQGYVKHAHERTVVHMNGEVCPISQVVLALAACVRGELEQRIKRQ